MIEFNLTEMGDHLTKHGDGAKDIAFEVEDLDAIMKVSEVLLVEISQYKPTLHIYSDR